MTTIDRIQIHDFDETDFTRALGMWLKATQTFLGVFSVRNSVPLCLALDSIRAIAFFQKNKCHPKKSRIRALRGFFFGKLTLCQFPLLIGVFNMFWLTSGWLTSSVADTSVFS